MPSLVFQPLVEVFLLVEQPRQRLSHWTQVLAPLDGVDAPPVATVDVHYDPTSNQAIFGLRYDELALGPDRLKFLVDLALLAEIGMIQPAELTEADRGRFVGERLARCTVHVGDQRKIVNALVELVRRVRDQHQKLTGRSPLAARASMAPRDSSWAGPPPRSTRDLAHGSVRQPKQQFLEEAAAAEREAERLAPAAPPVTPQAPVIRAPVTASARRLAGALPPRRIDLPRPSPNVVARPGVHRASTVMMSPVETERMLEEATTGTATLEESATTTAVDAPTEPYLPTSHPTDPDTLHARYLRSGRWVPIRIGALSLKGAALMACALPRIGDRVDVALSFANYRALVRGAVGKISTTQEAASSGATTFSVSFELDDGSRRELTALLTAARTAKVMLKPPPSRSTRRYPVEWPINLGTKRGTVRAEALDVSADGMFVKPLHALSLEAHVTFSMVLDDGLSPVAGRARVVRHISEIDARGTGLLPGYGLSIVEMADDDRERWSAFLLRIEQRSARRVLIGAAPARLAELQSQLSAAGYAVTGGSDPGAIAQLASADAHPVDAALIDARWLAAASTPMRVESLFSARKLPCVTVHGDAERARIAVDRLLSVV
jgi:PilZ domain